MYDSLEWRLEGLHKYSESRKPILRLRDQGGARARRERGDDRVRGHGKPVKRIFFGRIFLPETEKNAKNTIFEEKSKFFESFFAKTI